MENVSIGEAPFGGDPSPTDPYPQTLLISFTPAPGVTEVQIAPCWEGDLYFIADDQTGYPTSVAQVTQASAANWPLVGDLVLVTRQLDAQAKALKSHVPLLESAPGIARYSKVRLTTDFLFTTLAQASLKGMVVDGKLVTYSAQTQHPQLVIKFLRGEAGVPCAVDPASPANDFARHAMPVIALQPLPGETVLRIGMSSHAGLRNSWFAPRPEDPQIPNTPLVDPAIADEKHARFTLAHPAHSFVPPVALYQGAAEAAYVPDHWNAPLRALLAAPRADGSTWRRIGLKRPVLETASTAVSRFPTRPYPLYKVVWQRVADGSTESQRLPLDGVLYLPLADETYRFYVSRRGDHPPSIAALDEFALGTQTPPNRFLDLPLLLVENTLSAASRAATIHVHLLRHDSERVWAAFVELHMGYRRLMADAKNAWGLPFVNRWSIYVPDTPATRQKTGAMKDYARIHGFIRASSGRHGLAPEFLQSVFLGEAAVLFIEDKWNRPGPPDPFNVNELIPGFAKLGLDRIWDTVLTLGADHYLDTTRFDRGVLTNDITETNPEDGSTIRSADVIGWEAAVELVAAELHERLDWMLNVIGKTRDRVTELQRRFLAYGRYVSSENTSTAVALQMATLLKPWEGNAPPAPTPTDSLAVIVHRVRYKILQRLAVADWLERSGVYR
jgi:hypothetical protein